MAEEDSRYLASLERDALRKVLDWPLGQARRDISEDGRQVQGLVSALYGVSSPEVVRNALAPKLERIGKIGMPIASGRRRRQQTRLTASEPSGPRPPAFSGRTLRTLQPLATSDGAAERNAVAAGSAAHAEHLAEVLWGESSRPCSGSS